MAGKAISQVVADRVVLSPFFLDPLRKSIRVEIEEVVQESIEVPIRGHPELVGDELLQDADIGDVVDDVLDVIGESVFHSELSTHREVGDEANRFVAKHVVARPGFVLGHGGDANEGLLFVGDFREPEALGIHVVVLKDEPRESTIGNQDRTSFHECSVDVDGDELPVEDAETRHPIVPNLFGEDDEVVARTFEEDDVFRDDLLGARECWTDAGSGSFGRELGHENLGE